MHWARAGGRVRRNGGQGAPSDGRARGQVRRGRPAHSPGKSARRARRRRRAARRRRVQVRVAHARKSRCLRSINVHLKGSRALRFQPADVCCPAATWGL